MKASCEPQWCSAAGNMLQLLNGDPGQAVASHRLLETSFCFCSISILYVPYVALVSEGLTEGFWDCIFIVNPQINYPWH